MQIRRFSAHRGHTAEFGVIAGKGLAGLARCCVLLNRKPTLNRARQTIARVEAASVVSWRLVHATESMY
jgi:hypothetical protein